MSDNGELGSRTIFVSYAREDKDCVAMIRNRFESASSDVWLDTDDLVGGEDWMTRVVTNIEKADALIVVLSEHSVASTSVETEVGIARDENERRQSLGQEPINIVPIKLDQARPDGKLRFCLQGKHVIDATGGAADWMPKIAKSIDGTHPVEPRHSSTARPDTEPGSESDRARRRIVTNGRGRWLIAALVVLLVVVALVIGLTLVIGDGEGDPSVDSEPTSVATAAPSTEDPPEQSDDDRGDRPENRGGLVYTRQLRPNTWLEPGDRLASTTGDHVLEMSAEGQLVATTNGGEPWFAEPAVPQPGAAAIMQDDGNFVLYRSRTGGDVLFSTLTNGLPGAFLVIEDDGGQGFLAIRSGNDEIDHWRWQSR